MPRHVTSLGSGSFATSSKILQKYEQDRMYQIHKQKLENSKHMLNNSRPGTYPHLLLRLKQIQKEEERQAEVDHDNKILLNRMTKILKYGGQVDNWNNYESRSLNYPYRERQTKKIARENRGIARRLEKVRPVYQRKKWDSEYKQHEYLRSMLAESTKDYTKLTPRRYNSRISKARSLDTGLSQLYEDDFESDHEEDEKTKLPKLKEKRQNPQSKDSVKNETKPVKLPHIQQNQNQMQQDENQRMLPTPDLSMYLPPREQKIKISSRKEKRKKSQKTIGTQTSISESSGDNSDYGDEDLQNGQLTNQPKRMAYPNDKGVESNNGLENVQTLVNNMADDQIQQNDDNDNDYGEETYGHIDENEVEVSEMKHHQNGKKSAEDRTLVKSSSGIANKLSIKTYSQFKENKMSSEINKTHGKGLKKSEHETVVNQQTDSSLTTTYISVKHVRASNSNVQFLKDISKRTISKHRKALASENKGNGIKQIIPLQARSSPHDQFHSSLNEIYTGHNTDFRVQKSHSHVKESQNSPHEMHSLYRSHKATLLQKADLNHEHAGKEKTSSSFPNRVPKVNALFNSSKLKEMHENSPEKSSPELGSEMNNSFHIDKQQHWLYEDSPSRNISTQNTKKHGNAHKSSSHSDVVWQGGSQYDAHSDVVWQGGSQYDAHSDVVWQGGSQYDAHSDVVWQGGSQYDAHADVVWQGGSQYDAQKDHAGNTGTGEDNNDITLLFKAAKQMAKPDEVFIKVLVKKSHKQRMPLKEKFRQKYDLDLMTELKSGLGLDWERLIDAMLQEQGVSDAFAVFDALSAQHGKKTSDYIDIVEILCARDNAGISELKDSYRQEFSISLEEDITDRTDPPVQTLLLALVKGHKEGSGETDPKEAWNDAKELHESGDDRWTGESGTFLKLLTEKPFAHLKSVLSEFKVASGGRDVLEIVKEECPADYHRAMTALISYIKGPSKYYAEVLFKHKVSSNDSVFVSTLVTRSEIDMPMVRKLYKKKYDSDLVEDISTKPHPTRAVLVALASKIPPTTKTKESLSKITYGRGGPPSAIRQQQSTPKKWKPNRVRQPDEASIAASIDSNPLNQPSKRVHAEAAKQQHKEQEVKEGPHEDRDHNGTVKPAKNFNAYDDCERLQKAMDGRAADMGVIISIIPKRSNKQRQELKRKYDEKFKKNLMIELEEELQGDFEEIVLALMMMPHEYDAYCIHEAVEGLGTSEATLLGILGTRSGREMRAIKEHYKKAHKLDMEKDIVADTSSPFAHLLVQLMQGNREIGSDVNTKEAEEDAKKLYKDGKPLDPDDSTFKDLLAKKNHAQIKAIFEEYKKIAGTDIYASLTKANLGDDEDSYISLAKAIEDPVHFYAEKLHDCFSGLGTNDNMLIRIVISRSEMDLIDIKEKYEELYSKSLSDSVQNECKGDYKHILLAIIGDNADYKNEQTAAKAETISPEKTMSTSENKRMTRDNLGATVKPVKDFDVTKDSERLHNFLRGLDEKAVVDIIPKRSNDQRQAIKAKFKDMYQQDLKKELKSELGGDYEEIVLALLMTPAEYDAHCLHDAMAGLGTNETVLTEILSTRNDKELAAMQEQYKKAFKTDLEKDIEGDTSGNFREMLLELLKGQRNQGLQVNMEEARGDAEHLSENGEIDMVTKSATFINILVKKNRAQVKATFEEYKKLYGHDIYHCIVKMMMGDAKEGYIGLAKAVEDTLSFYAEKFHECFAGKGTNDKQLIRLVVSRSEIDLEFIKVRYREIYKKTLKESVGEECSGNYNTVLLAVIGDKEITSTSERKNAIKLDRKIPHDGIDDRRKPAEVGDYKISEKKSPEKNTPEEGKGATVYTHKFDVKGKNGVKFDGNVKDDGKQDGGDHDTKGRDDESQEIEGNKMQKEKECKAIDTIDEKYEERNETDCKREAENDEETTNEAEQGKSEENEAVKHSDKEEPITSYKDLDKHKSKKDNVEPPQESEDCRKDVISDQDAKQKARLVPAKRPSDEEDITVLHSALYKDSPINKETIIRLLSTRTLEERLNLRDKYNEYYNEDVVVAFQDRLSGNFQQLVVALVLEPEVRDAWQLRSALLGFGTDEVTVAHILCTRAAEDLQWIKARYSDLYKKELLEDIKSDTSGSTRILLLGILRMASSENDQRREIENITEEVMQKLWKPGMKATKETDDAIIKVVTLYSQNHLKQVSEKYKEMNGIDLMEGIKRSTKGDFQNCLLTLVMSKLDMTAYIVDVLSKILKSFIIKDRALINILMTCFDLHVDMTKILENFQQINGKTLQTIIKHKCSGEYGKLLLELLQT